MLTKGSVSRLLPPLQEGDPSAVQKLWELYFQRLVGLARKRLQGKPRGAADEEDVALSAFESFCRHAGQGRFPQLADRDSLWRLLVTLTARKASRLVRDAGRQKRGGAAPVAFAPAGVEDDAVFGLLLSRDPSPAFAAEMAEEYRRLLDCLADPELMEIAVWRMEERTVEELATLKGCAPRTVKRKLQLIRDIWRGEASS